MPASQSGRYLADIKCPFFLRESGSNHNIVCEGPDFWSSVSVNYGNNEPARRRHIEKYCCTMDYCRCRVYRLISCPKYEEDDEP